MAKLSIYTENSSHKCHRSGAAMTLTINATAYSTGNLGAVSEQTNKVQQPIFHYRGENFCRIQIGTQLKLLRMAIGRRHVTHLFLY